MLVLKLNIQIIHLISFKAFIEKQELKNHMKTHEAGKIPRKTRKSKITQISANDQVTSFQLIPEQIPEQSVVSAVQVSTEDAVANLLPIVSTVNVQYFTEQQTIEIANQSGHHVMLPSTSHQEQHIVYESVPLENLTFATFIRPQQEFTIQTDQIVAVKDAIYEQANLNEKNLKQQNDNEYQEAQLRGCKLCKQHFSDVRQHLVDYHRIIISEFEDIQTFIF